MNSFRGLTSPEAQQQLAKYGLNELPSKTSSSALQLFFTQFKNFLVLILIIAASLSFFVGDKLDAILIVIILLLNALLGFWQEYKASKELEALRKLEVSFTRVIRNGLEQKIPSHQLVPGDLIVLESGDKVPADAKVIESYQLSVNESALTGESMPVIKSTDGDDSEIFFGTVVVGGRAKVEVLVTGSNTKFGKIALMLSGIEEEQTPLEKNLSDFSKKVGILAIFSSLVIFGIRVYQGDALLDVFFSSIALMVAAVPEGLPTVITIALAIGVRRMYQKKTLIRKMSAIESLGATTLICTDKTGTLTMNEMSVKKVISEKQKEKLLIKTAILCNSASLVLKENHGSVDILGDSTESALLVWAKDQGIDIDLEKSKGEIIEELPFDLGRRRMSVLWQEKDTHTLYTKGAPEVILSFCKLTKTEEEKAIKEYKALASQGLRVLAFGYKQVLSSGYKNLPHQQTKNELSEDGLHYLGLIGIADSARPEAKKTIQEAKNAGIKIVMVTGDNELTAKAIAEEVGLLSEGDEILTGLEIEELSESELADRITKVRIFARVLPEQKLKIIQAFQKRGEVVAVTGDGVNDALALKQAQIGVAMGTTGTDVAKEAADVVILDDNLSTIVSAVEQGRLIYQNILKVVKFLMAGNLSELLLIVFAVILGLPTPLLPAQILWINFVTDGIPAIALAVDPASNRLMKIPPRPQNSSFLSRSSIKFILTGGILISVSVLAIFYILLTLTDLTIARSYAFSTMVFLQMIMIFAMRRHHGVLSNKALFWSVLFVLVMQSLILYYPPLQEIFKIDSGLH